MTGFFEGLNTMYELIIEYWPYFLNGTRNTIALSLFAVLGGCVLAVLIALMRMSKNKFVSSIASFYIAVFRGTPMIVQLWIFYLQLSKIIPFPEGIFLGMDLTRMLPCLMALSFNSAAYIAEILRAGIESIDKGQMEAARSLGMPHMLAMRLVIFPQAVKNILPAICNEFITLVKETAIIQYLGVADLMYSMNTVKSATYIILENYYIVGIIYFIINIFASKGVKLIEKRLATDIPRKARKVSKKEVV